LGAARFAYVLAHPADDLVHALKYEGWPELASMMGRDLARLDLPAGTFDGPCVVVPVPTTARRKRSRGYNQAELLAANVAGPLGVPLCRALVRVSEGRSQTALTPTERRENVRGVFAPEGPTDPRVVGARVLLVDDVLTTGATASEAASALVAMGARAVTLLAFARALPGGPRR
jgi:ComF family protein